MTQPLLATWLTPKQTLGTTTICEIHQLVLNTKSDYMEIYTAIWTVSHILHLYICLARHITGKGLPRRNVNFYQDHHFTFPPFPNEVIKQWHASARWEQWLGCRKSGGQGWHDKLDGGAMNIHNTQIRTCWPPVQSTGTVDLVISTRNNSHILCFKGLGWTGSDGGMILAENNLWPYNNSRNRLRLDRREARPYYSVPWCLSIASTKNMHAFTKPKPAGPFNDINHGVCHPPHSHLDVSFSKSTKHNRRAKSIQTISTLAIG